MAFSEDVIERAWGRQGGRCAACGKRLAWDNRYWGERGAWHPHHKLLESYGGTAYLNNCAILCINPPNCHLNVGHGGDWSRHVPLSEENLPYFRYGELSDWERYVHKLMNYR